MGIVKNKAQKFDYAISNPPYQMGVEDTSAKQVYNEMMDFSFGIAKNSCFITPARFLFNAGKTPKSWNEKMLNDGYFRVEQYFPKSTEVFPGIDIKGGVAITSRDINRDFDPILTFSHIPILSSIIQKVLDDNSVNLASIAYLQNKFDLNALYQDYPAYVNSIGSKGTERRLTSSIFSQIPIFDDTANSPDDVKILGVINNKRLYKWIDRKYIADHENLDYYKVIVPKSNSSGAIGEVLSTPLIGTPLVGAPLLGFTQSFISFGRFENQSEAVALLKYIQSRFSRVMLGTLKVTQHNNIDTWENVPVQDFTSASDIDWKKSVQEIDAQLYEKYELTHTEIAWIEENIAEMQ